KYVFGSYQSKCFGKNTNKKSTALRRCFKSIWKKLSYNKFPCSSFSFFSNVKNIDTCRKVRYVYSTIFSYSVYYLFSYHVINNYSFCSVSIRRDVYDTTSYRVRENRKASNVVFSNAVCCSRSPYNIVNSKLTVLVKISNIFNSYSNWSGLIDSKSLCINSCRFSC